MVEQPRVYNIRYIQTFQRIFNMPHTMIHIIINIILNFYIYSKTYYIR